MEQGELRGNFTGEASTAEASKVTFNSQRGYQGFGSQWQIWVNCTESGLGLRLQILYSSSARALVVRWLVSKTLTMSKRGFKRSCRGRWMRPNGLCLNWGYKKSGAFERNRTRGKALMRKNPPSSTPLPVAKGQPKLKLWPASVDTHSFLNCLKSRDKHVVGILNI